MQNVPHYRLIYEALRGGITSGRYVAGDPLPSENELCADYGVTRPTVRKALDMLASDGYITRRQGRKSVVKGTPRGIGILSLSGTSSALGETLRTPVVVKPEVREWTDAFGFRLTEAERAAGCVYFERLRVLGDEPVLLDITMLPNIGIPRFTSIDMENLSLFDLLRTRYQITVTGGEQQLFAIGADRHLRENLRVRQGHPVLQLNRRIETDREGFCVYSRIFCVTGKYGLSGTF
jgi:DNA-binding GntR family transcriptional regulator